MYQGRWIALPTGAAALRLVYRKSMLSAAGFDAVPQGLSRISQAVPDAQGAGHAPGFALGHATGDANGWTQWVLWGFGGRLADENSNVAINSKETIAALEYAKELYQTFAPGTLSWLDPSNNKAFLAGEISLTINGISIYYAAKNFHRSEDAGDRGRHPALLLSDRTDRHSGRMEALMFPAFIFKYSKYPNAAKEYLRFMMEKEQYEPWQTACIGYVSHPLRAYESNPVWTADPQHIFYRDVVKTCAPSWLCRASSARRRRPPRRGLRRGRHVRGGVHGTADGEGSDAARGEAGVAALPHLTFDITAQPSRRDQLP